MTAAITYIRVSRPRQGRSGLGLEAPHEAIARFAEAHGFRIAETFSEVERGRAPMRSTAFGGYSFPGVGQYEVITGIATGEVNPGDEKNMVSPIFCARRGSLTATSNTSTIPRMEVLHTSERERGQVYVPAINYILLVAVLVTVLLFRTSNALGAAYGIAVTGTMVVDTTLAHKTARQFGKMHSAAVTHRGRLVLHAPTVRRNNGAQVQHPGLMLGDQPRDKQQADARNSKLARFWSV